MDTIENPVSKAFEAKRADSPRKRGRPARPQREKAISDLRQKEFGQRLRSLREARKMSAQDIERLIGETAARSISQYESRCYPSGRMARKIADCLGMSPRDMVLLILEFREPEFFMALEGRPAWEPSEREIREYLTPSPKKTEEVLS